MWQAHDLVNAQSDHARLLQSGRKIIPTCTRVQVRKTASHDTIVKLSSGAESMILLKIELFPMNQHLKLRGLLKTTINNVLYTLTVNYNIIA